MQNKNGNGSRTMYDFSVLRTLRKKEGMTLSEVSQTSGVSVAVISKLERNQTTAELETLYRLSRVFGMSATDLIGLSEKKSAQKTQARHYTSGGFAFDRVEYSNIRCFFAKGGQDVNVSRPEIHRNDYEVCWVLEGEVVLSLPNERYQLKAGEAVQFDAVLEHTYQSLEESRLIILHIRKDKRF